MQPKRNRRSVLRMWNFDDYMNEPDEIRDPEILPDNCSIDNPYWKAFRELGRKVWDATTQEELYNIVVEYKLNSLSSLACKALGDGPPYLIDIMKMEILTVARDIWVDEYSWALCPPSVLNFVAKAAGKKVVEVCAGNGYWAWLLHQYGIYVVAIDIDVANRKLWYPVLPGDHSSMQRELESTKDWTLLLVWPPYGASIAYETLMAFEGSRVIYVGEWEGCTADDKFHDELNDNWILMGASDNLSYPYIKDNVYIYERKNPDSFFGESKIIINPDRAEINLNKKT